MGTRLEERTPERLRFGAALMLVVTYGITVGGLLPITRMVRTGAVFDVIGAVLCVVGVAVMARVVGLA